MNTALEAADRNLAILVAVGAGIWIGGTLVVAVTRGTLVAGVALLVSLFGFGLLVVAGLWFAARFVRQLLYGERSA